MPALALPILAPRPARAALALVAALSLPLPAAAQVLPDAPADAAPGLMERGAEMLLRGLIEEARPAIEGFEQAWSEFRPQVEAIWPMVEGLLTLVEDVTHYDPPERQPNGDILIRRRADAPPLPVPEGAPPEAAPDDIPPGMPDMGPAPEVEL